MLRAAYVTLSHVTLTLQDVLNHELIRAAKPRLVSGADRVGRPIRWVHSADLYDIAPLLRGGEVLLTNGVGLQGLDESKRRMYVQSLAARGISALLFEVGRTWQELPADMAAEAIRLDLPLVVLDPVLRFTEVAEALNGLVIDESVARLRHADEISRRLSETLARGGDMDAIVDQISAFTGRWVDLRNDVDEQIASAGELPSQTHDPEQRSAPVLMQSTTWGRLTLGTAGLDAMLADAVLDRAPTVIALALMRHQPGAAGSLRVRRILIEQLIEGQRVNRGVLADRLRASGLPIEDHEYVCVVATTQANQTAISLLTDISRQFGQGLAGISDDVACAVIVSRPCTSGPALAMRVQQSVDTELAKHGHGRAGVGRTLRDIEDLPRSMSETRLALTMAEQVCDPRRVILGQDFAVERLLHHYDDQAELRDFVDEQLGALLLFDSQHESRLIETLEALVDASSRAAAAERLHIRRQSLYYRLRKIETLLEIDLDDPRQLGIVLVALAGSRILGGATR